MKVSSARFPSLGKLSPSWDLVGPSWRLLVKHFEQVIFFFALPSLVLLLSGLLLGDTSHLHHLTNFTNRQRLGIGLMGLSLLWSLVNFAPSLYFRVRLTGGEQPSLAACYRRGLPYFWRLAGLNLLLGVLLVVGFLLFIVPGIVLLVLFISRYYLANYYLVDRNLGIKQALLQSHHETAPIAGTIWGTVGVGISFSLLAGLVSAINPIAAVPAVFIQLIGLYIPALRYHEIKQAYTA